MLTELSSPAFMESGTMRPKIRFKPGLNIVLGKADGENSIGKSTSMPVIDFAFGGNTYADKNDAIRHIGDHTLFFAFRFNGQNYYFSRSTASADTITVCNENYAPTETVYSKSEFVNWLKKMYAIDFVDLSFRETLSSFFRIAGKENIDVLHPLRGIKGAGMEKSIRILVKLFDRYKDVKEFSSRLEEQSKKLTTYTNARKYQFVSDIVDGKTQFEGNLALIHDLEMELESLTESQAESHSEEEIKKSKLKSKLKAEKLKLERQIESKEHRVQLLDMSLEYGLYPQESELTDLHEYFPTINIRKLYDIENYHRKLAVILDQQFSEEKQNLLRDIEELKNHAKILTDDMKGLGITGNLSKEFLDRHSEIKGKIDALKEQNAAYLTLTQLKEAKSKAASQLHQRIEGVLADIQNDLNYQMKMYNGTLYREQHKPPHLVFREYNSYIFETPDDTGTGTNYKGLVLYDLAVLALTALPAIGHDSLILKNVSDGSIDGIMRIYEGFQKQIFIAFDKQDAYQENTRRIVKENTVLKLSDNGGELYGYSWNTERGQ